MVNYMCISLLSVAVVKYHYQKQLRKKWFTIVYGSEGRFHRGKEGLAWWQKQELVNHTFIYIWGGSERGGAKIGTIKNSPQ